jgi:RNA polymerase sigma-70 factor (ECF subfamily)
MALMCGSYAAAEDAVQEALARAWERSERGQYIGSIPGWVTTVARNLLRDRFRRAMAEARARRRLAVGPEGAAEMVHVERQADVERALAGLPRRQREVAVFHYFLDLEVAEIARVLGAPDGTVKSALHRARRSLARALGENVEQLEVGDVGDR